MLTFECFASVVPNRKLLSAQLSKTLVNRCFYIKMLNFSAFHRFFYFYSCSINIITIFTL